MALTRLRGAGITANAITAAAIAPGAVNSSDIADSITLATPTINSPIVSLGLIAGTTVEKLFERANVQIAAAPASLTYSLLDQSVLYFTDNSTANVSINFTGNDTTTLNSVLGNQSNTISAVLLLTNGDTPNYVDNVQIDGTVIYDATIKGNLYWLGNTITVPGNPVAIDAYSFTIIKKADASFTVLASQSEYKSFL